MGTLQSRPSWASTLPRFSGPTWSLRVKSRSLSTLGFFGGCCSCSSAAMAFRTCLKSNDVEDRLCAGASHDARLPTVDPFGRVRGE
jgi:hypothetical protein